MGNPKFTLRQFHKFGKLDCPARRHLRMVPHDSPTLRSPRRTIVLFAQLGHAFKLPHTGASAQDTPPFTISIVYQKSHRAHLHKGRVLTRVTQEPVPSCHTNQAPTKVSPSGAPSHKPGATHPCTPLPTHRALLPVPFTLNRVKHILLRAASPRMGAAQPAPLLLSFAHFRARLYSLSEDVQAIVNCENASTHFQCIYVWQGELAHPANSSSTPYETLLFHKCIVGLPSSKGRPS